MPRVKDIGTRCITVLRGRTCTTVWGVLTMLVAGTLYAYSLYAPRLKTDMKYSQTESSAIGALGDLGLYIGAPLGRYFDTRGPRRTLAIAAGLLLTGYIGMTVCYETRESSTGIAPAWVLGLFFFVVGQGSTACYVSSMGTNTQNYLHKSRGRITGILACAFGLSSGLLSGIFQLFFVGHDSVTGDRILNVSGFLLFLTLFCPITAFSSAMVMRIIPPQQEMESLPQDEFSDTRGLTVDTNNGVGVVNGSGVGASDRVPASMQLPTVTGVRLLRSPLFYLHFSVLFIGAGCGLMYINSMGSLSKALGGREGDQNKLIIIFAVFNALSRIVVGSVSDRFRLSISRATFLLGCIIVMGAAHFSLLFLSLSLLPLGTILVAIAYGGIFSMSPCIISELFGTTALGFNWGMTTLASGFGGLFFNVVSGIFYDGAANRENGDCVGRQCYASAFTVNTVACLIACVICIRLIFAVRTRQRQYLASLCAGPLHLDISIPSLEHQGDVEREHVPTLLERRRASHDRTPSDVSSQGDHRADRGTDVDSDGTSASISSDEFITGGRI